jgi:UDP-3-O-[3-hydroxymyristoyl] glucosamine N-acyltransferase
MPITLQELADRFRGGIVGEPGTLIRGAAPFEEAGPEDITLAGTPAYLKRLEACRAGVLIVPRPFACEGRRLLQVDNPYAVFAQVLALFHPLPAVAPGIHPTAVVEPGARLGSAPCVGAQVAIGRGVVIGDRATIFPGVVIADGVSIGDDVRLFPNVSVLERCRLGHRVTVHAGSVIGSDGFGFAPDGDIYHKIPHTGIVEIEDDVEIGAGNTIDRATFGRTWIRRGVKTDNLVHIAHNVTVGENTILVAQVGISGSTRIGRNVILAGQVGVAGHLEIGDRVKVGGKSGISRDVAAGEVLSGAPEMPHTLWLRVQRLLPRLPEMRKRITELERRLRELEESRPAPR